MDDDPDRAQYLERVRMMPDISMDVTSQVDRVLTALEQHVSQGQRRAENRTRLDRSRIDGRYYEDFVLLVDGGRPEDEIRTVHRTPGFAAWGAAPNYVLDREWGGFGSGPGQFRFPAMIAVDAQSNVYVVDQHNHRVQKFDSGGRLVAAWGEEGPGSCSSEHPFGIAVNSRGEVYVSDTDNHRIEQFTAEGKFIPRGRRVRIGRRPVQASLRAGDRCARRALRH